MNLWATVADERRGLADLCDTLTDEQLARPSLCGAWTVKDVYAHLCVALKVNPVDALREFAAARGNFHRANIRLTEREADRPAPELAQKLRAGASLRYAPPGLGAVAPLTDALVHGQDIRVPLGLGDDSPGDRWVPSLRFIVGPKARVGFTRKGLPALTYRAADADWTHGTGPEVTGPAAALALTILGRPVRAGELSGPGAEQLTAWSSS